MNQQTVKRETGFDAPKPVSARPHRFFLLLLAALCVLSQTGCAQSNQTTEQSTEPQTFTADASGAEVVELSLQSGRSKAGTTITLSGETATVEGTGASVSGNTVTITAGGVYTLKGSLTGQIIVSPPATTEVELILAGVDITGSANAAIYCTQAEALTVTLAEGSVNTLTDAQDFTYSDTAAEEPNAALFSKVDLTLAGNGALTVNASFSNGIGTKDDLLVTGGTLNVTAANDGLRGRDSVTVQDGSVTVTSGADGIQSNNDEDVSKGWIALEGGSFDITAGRDGIQAETSLQVSGGTYNILSGPGAQNASAALEAESYKGLKAGGALHITGGSFTLDTADDCLHSNGNLTIDGGTFALASGDDGVHSDADLSLAGGELSISQSYEGLEGNNITISNGVINLTASDDGINVAGGNDDLQPGRFGTDQFSGTDSGRMLTVSGGEIHVDAGGDGIDVNGSAIISGGSLYVEGPTMSGNSALDYDGSFDITGGILVASGAAGMAQAPSESSTQPSLMLYYSTTQAAGTAVTLTAADNTPIIDFTPQKEYGTILISAPALVQNASYTLSSAGNKVADVALTGVITSVSDTGGTVATTMFGRGGGGGGMGKGSRSEGLPPSTTPAATGSTASSATGASTPTL